MRVKNWVLALILAAMALLMYAGFLMKMG